jgi:hypothetical protein
MFFEHPRPIAITFCQYRTIFFSEEDPRNISTRIVYNPVSYAFNPGLVPPPSIPIEQ